MQIRLTDQSDTKATKPTELLLPPGLNPAWPRRPALPERVRDVSSAPKNLKDFNWAISTALQLGLINRPTAATAMVMADCFGQHVRGYLRGYTHNRLARLMRCHPSTTRKHVYRLEAVGLLAHHHTWQAENRQGANAYRLQIPAIIRQVREAESVYRGQRPTKMTAAPQSRAAGAKGSQPEVRTALAPPPIVLVDASELKGIEVAPATPERAAGLRAARAALSGPDPP